MYYNLWIEFGTTVARLGFKRRATAVLKSNLIRSIEFGKAVARLLKRALLGSGILGRMVLSIFQISSSVIAVDLLNVVKRFYNSLFLIVFIQVCGSELKDTIDTFGEHENL